MTDETKRPRTLDTSEYTAFEVVAGIGAALLLVSIYALADEFNGWGLLPLLAFVALLWAHYKMFTHYTRRSSAIDIALEICDLNAVFREELKRRMARVHEMELKNSANLHDLIEQRAPRRLVSSHATAADTEIAVVREEAQKILDAARELELGERLVDIDAYAPQPLVLSPARQ